MAHVRYVPLINEDSPLIEEPDPFEADVEPHAGRCMRSLGIVSVSVIVIHILAAAAVGILTFVCAVVGPGIDITDHFDQYMRNMTRFLMGGSIYLSVACVSMIISYITSTTRLRTRLWLTAHFFHFVILCVLFWVFLFPMGTVKYATEMVAIVGAIGTLLILLMATQAILVWSFCIFSSQTFPPSGLPYAYKLGSNNLQL